MNSIDARLIVLPATANDIPILNDIWFSAFKEDQGMMHIFPDKPSVRRWMTDWHNLDFATKPFQYYLKVVDLATKSEQGKALIIAYAKWDTSLPNERGPRFPPWAVETPSGEASQVFDMLERNRDRVMGNSKHYYLDMLCTHPDFRNRGAGSMLVEWGCSLADKDGVPAYVDASKSGASLYKRFGFVDHSLPDQGDIASMRRPKTV